MTRDEAVGIVSYSTLEGFTPATIVDVLSDLGLLKFDEVKSADDRARDVLEGAERLAKAGVPVDAFVLLDAAGLKIVEK